MFELCMWSGYFNSMTPEDAIVRLVKNEWRYTEFSSEHAARLLERGNPGAVGREYRRFADDAGIFIPQGHLWLHCDIAALDQDEVLDQLKRWVDLFQGIGIKHAVLHAGGKKLIEQGCDQEKIHELRVRALQIMTEYVKGTDLIYCIENTAVLQNADGLINLIEHVGSPHLGICLDTGHLNRFGGDTQRDFILKTKSYLKALHINDNEGVNDQHIMPYGKGTVNWAEVVSSLKEIGYSGIFNLEIGGESGRCPDYIKDIKLEYLKKIIHIMFEQN